jgi:hypothetical protein
MRTGGVFLALLGMLASGVARGTGPGEGFGEEMLMLSTAREAGSGGVAIEDPWRQGTFLEVGSIMLSSGLRWIGIGAQGGAGPGFRLAMDGFGFSPSGITGTREGADGTWDGEVGSVEASSWGARLLAQWTVRDDESWQVAVFGRASGLVQRLPQVQNTGVGAEAGAQARRITGGGSAMTMWVRAGPLGSGARRMMAGRVTAGVGWLTQGQNGLLGGAEGFGIGGEGAIETSVLAQAGAGATWWIGRLAGPGQTFFVRAGARYAAGTAQVIQPRAGIGVLTRTSRDLGFQVDYAIAPMGELGFFHYVTVGLKLPSPSEE